MAAWRPHQDEWHALHNESESPPPRARRRGRTTRRTSRTRAVATSSSRRSAAVTRRCEATRSVCDTSLQNLAPRAGQGRVRQERRRAHVVARRRERHVRAAQAGRRDGRLDVTPPSTRARRGFASARRTPPPAGHAHEATSKRRARPQPPPPREKRAAARAVASRGRAVETRARARARGGSGARQRRRAAAEAGVLRCPGTAGAKRGAKRGCFYGPRVTGLLPDRRGDERIVVVAGFGGSTLLESPA